MKIEKPAGPDKDLIIIHDVLSPEELDNLMKHTAVKFAPNPVHKNVVDNLQAMSGWSANEFYAMLEPSEANRVMSVGLVTLEKLRNNIKNIMLQEFSELDLVRFNDFGDISIRTPDHQRRMKPHVDGPPEIDRVDHGVRNLGANYYLNDDYEGGELYYPNLNFSYKPVPNSVVIHKGEEDYKHGVAEVIGGVRLSFGMFGFEHYEEEMFAPGHGVWSDE